MSDKFRLVRLVGDGDTSGGGLPLPDAFTAVVQELLDNGPGTEDTMVRVIRNALSYKEKRVMVTWRTWEDFARDILGQLHEAGIIEPTLGKWFLGLSFVLRERMTVIPEKNIGIIVYPHQERKQLNAIAKVKLEFRRTEARTAAMLTEAGVDDAAVHLAVAALVRMLDGDDSEIPQARPAKAPRRPPGIIASFTEKYLCDAHPQRVSPQEISEAFNAVYPPEPGQGEVKSGVVIQKLNKMRGEGTAQRFEEDDSGRQKVSWSYVM